MNVFAIADLHLSFSVGPEKSMDRFGAVWVDHADKIKKHWLSLVRDDDIVIIPGDFSWAMKLEQAAPDFVWLSELPGRKIFVRGNHDLWWGSLSKMRLRYPELLFIQNDSLIINGIAFMGSRGWIHPEDPDFKEESDRKIYERERMRFDMSFSTLAGKEYKKLICVTHFPPFGFMDLFGKYGVDKVVYGHLHGESAFLNAPEGIIDGIEYRLCSYDKLKGVPQLICRAMEGFDAEASD